MSIVKKPNGTVAGYALPSILDEFFNKDIFNWGSNYTNRGTSTPAVNIRETPEAFNVEMAAPGMDKKDFKIELDRHILTISAEKQDQNEPSDGELYNRK